MNKILRYISNLYSQTLHLYPRSFRDEFADEMDVVFRNSVHEAGREGMVPLIMLCLRELSGLPINILWEFWHEFERKETIMVINEKANTESAIGKGVALWDAILGTLPFALFGLMCMLTNIELPFHAAYPYIAFTSIVLLGLMIGLAKGFPHWAYSFLGWSLFMSFWWMMMQIDTLTNSYSPITHNLRVGLFSWIPFWIVTGIGLIWARSLRPLRQMASGIWQNWTYLSLMIYTFVAFVQLIYDENHSPYLLAFMAASTLVICWAVWVFLQSASSWKRVAALLSGFIVTFVLSNISYATWDLAAYYGLPPSTPRPWYSEILGTIALTALWSAFMFWPVLISLVRRAINNRGKPEMA
jgi:hypothetical protein